MNILTKWFFYILVVGVIGLLVGIILVFQIDNNFISGIVIGLAIIFIILGVVFWILEARKPVPQKEEKSIITNVPVLGDTLSESYKQMREQGSPVIKEQFKNIGNYFDLAK